MGRALQVSSLLLAQKRSLGLLQEDENLFFLFFKIQLFQRLGWLDLQHLLHLIAVVTTSVTSNCCRYWIDKQIVSIHPTVSDH